MKNSLRSLFVIGSAIIVLAGCGQSVADKTMEDAIERETGGDATVKTDDGTVEVTTEQGTMVIGAQELPSDWPKDVPVYPGSTVQMAGNVEGEGQAGLFLTADTKADVVKYYQEALVKDGWESSLVGDMGTMTILAGTKDERTVVVQIASGEGGTSITIGLEAETQE